MLLYAFSISATSHCHAQTANEEKTLRVATFNVSLNRSREGRLTADLRTDNVQAKKVASIIRTVRPDILLMNEFDYDATGESIQLFRTRFLQAAADETHPITYPYAFSSSVNTGVPSGHDFEHNGSSDGPGDSYGYGKFPGQYGMVVLSMFPIERDKVRPFQNLLWKNMPDAAIPMDPVSKQPWYSADAWNVFRLSSKSHWDIPVNVNGKILHVLASHPTPPAFDGPEDRNGKRNHDEIRLWAEYLSNKSSDWLVDDQGHSGGLPDTESFVILGDQNADPIDGNSHNNAIQQLLNHQRVNSTFVPGSEGATEATELQAGANLRQSGIARSDTADFSDGEVGNLRVDYVLPSSDWTVVDGGVFWPATNNALADAIDCSDHRLVWLDLDSE